MAELKRNTINQILFTMVDKVDFATPETSLASNFTVKVFGVTNGAAGAAAISTVASAVSKVGSGVYRVPLLAARCNYDQIMVRIAHASAATQMLWFDLPSRVLDVSGMSDIGSQVWAANINGASMVSNIASAVWAHAAGASLVNRLSQLISNVSDVDSALSSQYTKAYSAINRNGSQLSLVKSVVSDIDSALTSRFSDLNSYLRSVTQSTLSDIDSALSSQYTKTYSGVVRNGSQLSLVKSVVSDAHSAATLAAGRISVVASSLSDVDSALTSRFSDLLSLLTITGIELGASTMSDLRSAVAAGPAATIGASDVSLIAAGVWEEKYNAHGTASTIGSMLEVIASAISNVESALDSQYAKAYSGITRNGSQLSLVKSVVSDAHSAAVVNRSLISDVYSLVSDVYSAIYLTATASDIASAVWAQHHAAHAGASTFGSVIGYLGSSGVLLTSATLSDLKSAIAAGPTGAVTITDSDLSNIASRVWSEKYATHSLASSFGSLISVIGSQAKALSDVGSKVYARQASQYALISNYQSNFSNFLSDIFATQASQFLVVSNLLSNVSNYLSAASDVGSKIYARQASQYALISNFQSNFSNYLSNISAAISDVDSALTSRFSDFHSLLSTTLGASDLYSKVGKLASRITVPVATQSKLGVVESLASDAHSAAAKGYSQVILVASELSDVHSQTTLIVSNTSDIYSLLGSASLYSDIASAVWAQKWDVHSLASTFGSAFARRIESGFELRASDMSDLRSAISAGPAATITDADVSNIASRVWAASAGSDVQSKIGKLTSRVTAPVATSDYLSKVASDLRSLTSGITASVDNASVASAVWAHAVAASMVSRVSDIQSALDSQYAKVYSAVQAGGLNSAAISDIASAVWGEKWTSHSVASSFGSMFEVLSSRLSDTQSAVDSQYTKTYSAINMVGSQLSLVKSVVSDTHSQAKLAASHASDVHSLLTALSAQISDIDSALTSRFSDTLSFLRSVVASTLSDIESALDSQFAAGQELSASALSDVGSVVAAQLDTAFTDATSLNANGLKDRLRTMGWIIRNKMKVNDINGNTDIFKDDNATKAFSVTAGLTDDGTSTLRKRME